jgi:regulator of chromosome condensation
MAPPAQFPARIGEEEFKNKAISKVLSGGNHTLILAEGKAYAWGDPDTCVLGRMPTARRRLQQGLIIEGVSKNVLDIYTGGYHSFMKKVKVNKKKNEITTFYFAWGLNNYGQLGIGNLENSVVPTEIIELRNKNIKDIKGGEHHTIAITEDGEIYAWGRNDDG